MFQVSVSGSLITPSPEGAGSDAVEDIKPDVGPLSQVPQMSPMPSWPSQPTPMNPRWVEAPRDQARTDFFEEIASFCDLTMSEVVWRYTRSAEPVFTLHHPMAPDLSMEHAFPLRDPADPMRVHPRYATGDGLLAPAVTVRDVQPLVRPLKTLMKLTGVPGAARSRLCRDLAQDVKQELLRLVERRQASPRYEVRRLRAEDLQPHEQALAGQYGLFGWRDQHPDHRPTLGNGRVMGLFVGALLESPEQEAAYARSHPGYNSYMVEFKRGDGGLAGLTGLGAANGPSFANTALLPGRPAQYDQGRLNAHLMPFHVQLIDAKGKPSRATMVALIVTDAAYGPGNPTGEIRVDYGPHFLKEFDERRDELRPAPSPPIKIERPPSPWAEALPTQPQPETCAEEPAGTDVEMAPAVRSIDLTARFAPIPEDELHRLWAATLEATPKSNQLRCLQMVVEALVRGWEVTPASGCAVSGLHPTQMRRVLKFVTRPGTAGILASHPPRRGETYVDYLRRLIAGAGLPISDVSVLSVSWRDMRLLKGLELPRSADASRDLLTWTAGAAPDEDRAIAAQRIREVVRNVDSTLDLANLGLRELPPLGVCQQLLRLDLSGNRLTDVAGLKKLSLLRTLNLQRNELSAIPKLPRTVKDLHLGDNPGLTHLVSGEHDALIVAGGHGRVLVGDAGAYRSVCCTRRPNRVIRYQPLAETAWAAELLQRYPRGPRESRGAYGRRIVLTDVEWTQRPVSEAMATLRAMGLKSIRFLHRLPSQGELSALMRKYPQLPGMSDGSQAHRLVQLGAPVPAVRKLFGISDVGMRAENISQGPVQRLPGALLTSRPQPTGTQSAQKAPAPLPPARPGPSPRARNHRHVPGLHTPLRRLLPALGQRPGPSTSAHDTPAHDTPDRPRQPAVTRADPSGSASEHAPPPDGVP